MKCPKCSGSHAAYSKDCPKWILEKNIQRIKAERSISFTEARKIAAVKNENRACLGSRTAAAVVRSRSRPTPLPTRSVNVQTDLTWPNGQERPILVPSSTCKTQTCQTTSAVPAAKPCSSVEISRSPGKGRPDRHPPPGGAATSLQNTTMEEATRAFRRPQDKPPIGGKKKDKQAS